jgi:hypothetical protein
MRFSFGINRGLKEEIMEDVIQWRDVARAYYKKYVESCAEQGICVDRFDTLEEYEVVAIIEGLKCAVHLVLLACIA